MHDDFEYTSVRLRPIIKYLGLAVGIVAGLPSLIGCLWFLVHPGEIIQNPAGAVFALILGPFFAIATCRWMRIGGVIDANSICLRGWLRTVRIAPNDLAKVRHVQPAPQYDSQSYYELLDAHGNSLGKVPMMLKVCPDWKYLLQHLHTIAARSRT